MRPSLQHPFSWDAIFLYILIKVISWKRRIVLQETFISFSLHFIYLLLFFPLFFFSICRHFVLDSKFDILFMFLMMNFKRATCRKFDLFGHMRIFSFIFFPQLLLFKLQIDLFVNSWNYVNVHFSLPFTQDAINVLLLLSLLPKASI